MRLLLILAYLTSEGVLSGYITLSLSTDDIFDIMEGIDWGGEEERRGGREEGGERTIEGQRKEEREKGRETETERDREKETEKDREKETEREIRIPNITSDPLPPQWKQ